MGGVTATCRALLKRCSRGRASVVTTVNVILLTYMVFTATQWPFGSHSQPAKPSPRRTLRTAQQQQQQLQQASGPAEENFKVGDPDAESYFRPWIQQDFALWEQGGIKMSAVTEMALRYRECFGEVFRFQIINGTLWVDHISERHDGWYPSRMGEGSLAAKGKIPYAILAIMDTLRHHPGQVPDLDAIIQTSDFPCMLRQQHGSATLPPPVFGYNSHPRFVDVPFPDYSYWGHEYHRLLGNKGELLHGWEKQFDFLSAKWEEVDLAERKAQVVWRGRTEDKEYPMRDELRRQFSQCAEDLRTEGRAKEADLFSLSTPEVQLHDLGDYRYLMYIESDAWVTNLKQKLACGSVLMSNQMEFYEFFTRALVPGVHYIEIDSRNLCHDAARQVKAMNAIIDEAEDAELEDVDADTRRFLRETAGAVQNVSSQPWKVGEAGKQFLAEHVQMADVRLYIRDALQKYASLQRFMPHPSWNAECYTGEALLEQFGFPYAFDKQSVLRAYPWLAGYNKEECAGKLPRRVLEKDEVRRQYQSRRIPDLD